MQRLIVLLSSCILAQMLPATIRMLCTTRYTHQPTACLTRQPGDMTSMVTQAAAGLLLLLTEQ